MKQNKLMVTVETFLFLGSFIAILLWINYPSKHYDAWLGLFSLFLLITEGYRRYLDTKEIKKVQSKEDERKRIHDIALANLEKQNGETADNIVNILSMLYPKDLAPIGMKVRIIDSNKLPQNNKLTAPGWEEPMDYFSGQEAEIVGFISPDYLLDIDDGKYKWAGRWLTKV